MKTLNSAYTAGKRELLQQRLMAAYLTQPTVQLNNRLSSVQLNNRLLGPPTLTSTGKDSDTGHTDL